MDAFHRSRISILERTVTLCSAEDKRPRQSTARRILFTVVPNTPTDKQKNPTRRVPISSGYKELRVMDREFHETSNSISMCRNGGILTTYTSSILWTKFIIIDSFCNTLIRGSTRFSCKYAVSSVFTVITELT